MIKIKKDTLAEDIFKGTISLSENSEPHLDPNSKGMKSLEKMMKDYNMSIVGPEVGGKPNRNGMAVVKFNKKDDEKLWMAALLGRFKRKEYPGLDLYQDQGDRILFKVIS